MSNVYSRDLLKSLCFMLKSLCDYVRHTLATSILRKRLLSSPRQDLCRRLQPEVGRGERSDKVSAAPWSERVVRLVGKRIGTVPNFGGFPYMEVPKNWWFIPENPIKMNDLGVPPICGNPHLDVFFHPIKEQTSPFYGPNDV